MKQLILSVLIVVMLATPCTADVEPAGIFSLHGMDWVVLMGGGGNFYSYGFYEGDVYLRESGFDKGFGILYRGSRSTD